MNMILSNLLLPGPLEVYLQTYGGLFWGGQIKSSLTAIYRTTVYVCRILFDIYIGMQAHIFPLAD